MQKSMTNDRREQYIKKDLEDLLLTLYITPIESRSSRVLETEIRYIIKREKDRYDLSYYQSEMLNILSMYGVNPKE